MYDLWNVISAEVCILSDGGVTQIPVIWKRHTGIITKVIFFSVIVLDILLHRGGNYCILFIVDHLPFIVYHGVDYFNIVPLWP